MALSVATVEAELQRRLRIGSAEIALSDTNLYSVINYVQRTVNFAAKRVVSTGTLTLSTGADTLYYTTTSIAGDCDQVVALYLADRTIMRVPDWKQLQNYDRSWLNATGGRVEAWAPVAFNMIAIYPSLPTTAAAAATLTCVYIKETTTLNSSDDLFNIPDIDADLVYDLCEIVLLAHLKMFPEIKRKVEGLTRTLAPYIGG